MNERISSARDALKAIRQHFENVLERGPVKKGSGDRRMSLAIDRLNSEMPEQSIKIRELEQHILSYSIHRSVFRKSGEDRELARWALAICNQLESRLPPKKT
jgi:hypothetical protein